MPLKALTLLMTAPRILPEAVSTTGPVEEPLMSAARAANEVAAMVVVPRNLRRFILESMRSPRARLPVAERECHGRAFVDLYCGCAQPSGLNLRTAEGGFFASFS